MAFRAAPRSPSCPSRSWFAAVRHCPTPYSPASACPPGSVMSSGMPQGRASQRAVHREDSPFPKFDLPGSICRAQLPVLHLLRWL